MDLNSALVAAHEDGDKLALVKLYTQAANDADTIDSECFFLTIAYIFALETSHKETQSLFDRLDEHGRV